MIHGCFEKQRVLQINSSRTCFATEQARTDSQLHGDGGGMTRSTLRPHAGSARPATLPSVRRPAPGIRSGIRHRPSSIRRQASPAHQASGITHHAQAIKHQASRTGHQAQVTMHQPIKHRSSCISPSGIPASAVSWGWIEHEGRANSRPWSHRSVHLPTAPIGGGMETEVDG
jgi:hypothetical protein